VPDAAAFPQDRGALTGAAAFFEQCGDDVRAERLAGMFRRPARFFALFFSIRACNVRFARAQEKGR
jgi:hypothetical protein